MLAPVDAIPILTDGRSGDMAYSSGHQPKYTLDNDPDTWWEPDVYVTSTLYYDLGSSTSVDAVVLWLHNYNERYANNKSWRISWSYDDITYTPLSTKLFSIYRTTNTPVIVDEFSRVKKARYWRIEFLLFNAVPQTIVPEVSCVWFTNKYTLPWKHQPTETNTIMYHNNEIGTRSGHRFASSAGVGRQRIMRRQFMLLAGVDQWDNLYAAHAAAHGNALPIAIQSELDSDSYYVVYFNNPLLENKQEHDLRIPQLVLSELGHKRISFKDCSLISPHPNATIYHFNNNVLDTGLNGHDFTGYNLLYPDDEGVSEQGITVVNMTGSAYATIPAASATWADMGTDSFTIECWFRSTDDVCLCRKADEHFTLTTAGFYLGIVNQKMRLFVHDGVNSADISDGDTTTTVAGTIVDDDDNQWHYVVMVVNRTTDLMQVYIDGGLSASGDYAEVDISSVGSVSRVDCDLECESTNCVESYVDELTIIPDYAMSSTEIAKRYVGRIAYGLWGM